MKRIVSLCDYTGNMLKPWAEAGYRCTAVDLAQDNERVDEYPGGGSIRYIKRNVKEMIFLNNTQFCFAFPPCTDLAASGARWWAAKGLQSTIDALELVEACRLLCEQADGWMIENPVGRLSTCWRKPDYMFDPCDYGDAYTKKTCLWTGGIFIMPAKDRVEPEKVCPQGSFMQRLGGKSEKTKRIRSTTPMGFARAVFTVNGLFQDTEI